MMMNKKFLMLAAAATMFAACSNEMDTISSPEVAQDNTELSAQTPVLFDAYTGRALTRAGAGGALDNTALQTNGFGVFGYYTENEFYNDTYQPTFMYNAKVSGADWTYSPLKYWPNEFGGEAQSDDIDRLSFFAYAPYVHVNPSTGIPDTDDASTGITAMTRNSSTGDPFVKYAVNFADLTKQVDFSWGVAKEGAPTAVTGAQQATVAAGSPFKDLVKPAADQKIGFEFNHALAQLNVQVNADVDYIGSNSRDGIDVARTRIWVRSVTFEGFATKGAFNLNQSKDGAVWSDLSGNSISSSPVTIYDGRTDGKEGVSDAANETPAALNIKLTQNEGYTIDADNKIERPENKGVTAINQNLFMSTTVTAPLYVIPNQQDFKVTIVYDVETVDPKLPTYLADGVTKGSRVKNTISQTVTFGSATQLEAGKKYTLKLHLGMSTVKFDAQVSDWQNADPAVGEVMLLPINKGSNEGGLNNSLFAVSASKNVHFTPGNLQWISTDDTDATKGYWKIADSQYSFLGDANAKPESMAKGEVLKAGSVDLFGWGQVTPGSMYGSGDNTDYVSSITYENQQLPNDNNWATKFNNGTATLYAVDQPYQKPVGDGDYCVLTNKEWKYLFTHQYWGFAIVNLTNGGTVNGIVVCPSSVTTEEAAKAFLSKVYKTETQDGKTDAYSENVITQKTIDENGLLFLPAAGYRLANSVRYVGTLGCYWSTTAWRDRYAYYERFNDKFFICENIDNRCYGRSVRLATVAQ